MLKRFYRWRMRYSARMAIRSMDVRDYAGAIKWMRIAKRWERLAAHRAC